LCHTALSTFRLDYKNIGETHTVAQWTHSAEKERLMANYFDHTQTRSSTALGGVDSKDSLLGANQIQSCFWEAVLGVKSRLVLSDAAWERMAPLIIGRPDQKGSTGRDNRMFVEGVLWIVRTGSPWRDLPEAFGDWNSVFRRFSRWSVKGVWWRIFEAMSDDPDFEYLIVDSTIVRAHQHAAGAKKGGLKIRRSAARAVV
jgi:transposase